MQSNRKKNREIKYNSFDSETIKGFARIGATPYHIWKINNFNDFIEPIIKESIYKGTKYFCWNQNFDMRAVLKYLPLKNLQELALINETIVYDRYKIFYIEDKVCSIIDMSFEPQRRVTFYDIAQFYNYSSLDDAAKTYLNNKKLDNAITNNIKNHQEGFAAWPEKTMEDYFDKNFDEIGKYCQKDAILTQQLAEVMTIKIDEIFDIKLYNFSSKAAIAEKLSYIEGKYPRNFGMNSAKYRFATLSFRGGMFDCWRRGTFKEITEVDISSAYPAEQSKFPHWGNGQFELIKSEKDIKESDEYGWVIAFFDCSYIPYDSEQLEKWEIMENGKILEVINPTAKKILYPCGERVQIVTLEEFKFMKEYGFKCELISYKYCKNPGYVWREKTPGKYQSPFAWMQGVYNKKAEFKEKYGKKSIEYSLIKIALNGTYGKTVQRIGKHKMQDFRYGSYITAKTRVKIAKFIIDNNLEDFVILIATDGIYLKGHWEFSKEVLGEGLGSWDLDFFESGLVLGNGVYQFNKKNGDIKLKLRGYGSGKYYYKNYGPIEYNLINDIQKHRNDRKFISSHKAIHKRKPQTFKNCINREEPEQMNIFAFKDKVFSAFSDKTKHWPGIDCFDDLLEGNYKGERFYIEEIDKLGELEREEFLKQVKKIGN